MKKKILIFGGTGAIGFSIAKNLKDQGYNPIIISRTVSYTHLTLPTNVAV